MNDEYIVPVYVVIDELLKAMNVVDDVRASFTSAEIVTIAIVAPNYFQHHHERVAYLMYRLGYIGHLSVSRFNRPKYLYLKELAIISFSFSNY